MSTNTNKLRPVSIICFTVWAMVTQCQVVETIKFNTERRLSYPWLRPPAVQQELLDRLDLHATPTPSDI